MLEIFMYCDLSACHMNKVSIEILLPYYFYEGCQSNDKLKFNFLYPTKFCVYN